MTNVGPWQLFVVFMVFATSRSIVLSATIFKKYPYWGDYLTNPHTVQFNHYLISPVDVWPGRLFENYTKLTVSNKCDEQTCLVLVRY